MWMLNGYGMGAAGWLLMAVFWIALIALVVFAATRLLPVSNDRVAAGAGDETPREILKRRLASGEIDIDTFEQLSSKVSTRHGRSDGGELR